jgi:hypothetical protein
VRRLPGVYDPSYSGLGGRLNQQRTPGLGSMVMGKRGRPPIKSSMPCLLSNTALPRRLASGCKKWRPKGLRQFDHN